MHDTEAITVKMLKHLLNLLNADHAQESQEKSKKIKTMKHNHSKKIGFLEDLVSTKSKRLKAI